MMLKIIFVCLGNICRSPLAEGIMRQKLIDKNISNIVIDSCGTASYHLGNLADPRTRKNAESHGIQLTHRARQLKQSDYSTADYLVCMDRTIYNQVIHKKPKNTKAEIILMRNFDPYLKDADDVPDPYYGTAEDFEGVYLIIESCVESFIQNLIQNKSVAFGNN